MCAVATKTELVQQIEDITAMKDERYVNYLVTVLYHVLLTGFVRLRVSMHCLNKRDQKTRV